MSNQNKIDAWFDDFDNRMDGVPNIIAETATEYYKERLIEKNWEGVPYPKYNPNNKPNRPEPSAGSLMMRSNNLLSTIRPGIVQDDLVTIRAGGRKVRYARVHNKGLRVRGIANVRGYHNNNFMGKGQRAQIRPHTRRVDFKMPKRQFIGRSAMANERIRTRIIQAFK